MHHEDPRNREMTREEYEEWFASEESPEEERGVIQEEPDVLEWSETGILA